MNFLAFLAVAIPLLALSIIYAFILSRGFTDWKEFWLGTAIIVATIALLLLGMASIYWGADHLRLAK